MTRRVIIVGGGLAGLAAAEALSARQFDVTVLESRPRLGGRASSFEDKATGTKIDNCQHVSLGCCTNFRHFCDRTGLNSAFRTERELVFIGRDGRENRFVAQSLPAPFHLLNAFRRLSYFTNRDRLGIARGLASLAKARPKELAGKPFSTWLAQHEQTENAIQRFWHVVLVSALSESLDRIEAPHARKVFVDAFLANREGWTVQIPTEPLDELYGTRLISHLTRQGATIRLGSGVKRLSIDGDRVTGAELRSGDRITGDDFVLAVPHSLVRSLLPDPYANRPEIANLDQLETAPISSVHLWFDRPITPLKHAVLVDRLSHWIFNRTLLQPASSESGGLHYYQVVISASREIERLTSSGVIAAVHEELRDIWPSTQEAELRHSRLVTEHRAVFSVTPGSDRLRPSQQSALSNLQFAGDWTQTGWPATMEGAVRSGFLAAENILMRHRQPERLLQPDLPIAFAARWLFKLR